MSKEQKTEIRIHEGAVVRPGDTVILKSSTQLTPEQVKIFTDAFHRAGLIGAKWIVLPSAFDFVIKRGDGTE